jgi:hypothetical protein
MSENIPMKNTDTELFYEIDGDYYSPSCHMTKDKKLGINVGGTVIVKPLQEWHKLKAENESLKGVMMQYYQAPDSKAAKAIFEAWAKKLLKEQSDEHRR